ncbi:MAG: hypothetical protein ISR91_03160 [Candidatus Delongbacteria bacterium]|nr:hypothetical protein [bacterium]MBL7033121.1 hypothetical protein [Candidatus Delongbacteria bacterium]
MRLQTAALLVMLVILLEFVIRLGGTLWPALFTDPFPVLCSLSLSLLGDLALLTFFSLFRTTTHCANSPRLQLATSLAAAGAVVGLLVPLKALLFHARAFVFLPLLLTRGLELLAPPLAIISLLFFLVTFLQEADTRGNRKLALGIRYGLTGAGLLLFLHLLVILNFVIHYYFSRLSQVSHMVALVTLPLVTAGTFSLFYFFLVVWRAEDEAERALESVIQTTKETT